MSIKLGIQIRPENLFSDTLNKVKNLEQRGFDSIWLADHIVFLEYSKRCLNPWPIMAALVPYTSRAIFGSLVTDPCRRHPAVFAQSLATIDWISAGRLVLGIGVGEAMNLAPFNIPSDHKAHRLSEFIRILRLLWTGEVVDFQGQFFSLNRAFIRALPHKNKAVPIYVAANSPLTRKIAGRYGDGWISEMLSPELYKRDLEEVNSAAQIHNKGKSDIDRVYHVYCAIAEDGEAAKTITYNMSRMQFTWWPKQLQRYGITISNECDWNNMVIDDKSFAKSKALANEVPIKIAESVSIAGDVDECISKIEDYIDAGVSHFVFSIPGFWDETLKELETKVMPYIKESSD